ncbi:MAG: divalent-cation tolerance protein CutA [Candidatus Bathyarchaeota archaeon]|nr:divalent-cation tolerance protein CutA [Candidatus Termiticorpusculum sp.]
MSDFIMVYVTVASKVEAEKIAHALLSERLIACVNVIGPVFSHFHWGGKVDSVEEYLMIMKTCGDLFTVLEERVRVLHSYEVPEIIAVPIVDGSKKYFEWMAGALNH